MAAEAYELIAVFAVVATVAYVVGRHDRRDRRRGIRRVASVRAGARPADLSAALDRVNQVADDLADHDDLVRAPTIAARIRRATRIEQDQP